MKRIALAVAVAFAPFAANAQTPIDDWIGPNEGASACFIRVYKPDHLKAHPKQKTKTITVWIKYDPAKGPLSRAFDLALGITTRNDPAAVYSQGGCNWSETANRGTGNERLLKTYPKEAGASCIQSAQPDVFEAVSAQEGGFLLIDRGKDRYTMMVYLDDSLTMVKRANRSKHLDIKFGRDDRVFALQRVEPESCTELEEAVMTPEPGVRRR